MMKKALFLVVLVALAVTVTAYAGPVMWGFQPPGSSLPRQTMFTGNYGYSFVTGWGSMMHGGMMTGQCPWFGWSGGPTPTPGPRLTIQQAQDSLERFVAGLGPNFVLHEIMEFQLNFYAIVKEQDTGIGAFELLVNPYTGQIYPEPGPNMMWNTKYGMHQGMMRQFTTPTADMPISPEQAEQIALNYLRNRYTGDVEIEHATRFYGYYTLDYKLDGRIHGMLSVNGFTGQVWYHWWHGPFIQEIELEES